MFSFSASQKPYKIIDQDDAGQLSKFIKSINYDPKKLNSFPLLHYAAWFGKINCLRLLAQQGDLVVNQKGTSEGKPAIHCAAFRGHSQCVKILHELGADINMSEELTGRTALHKAVIADKPEIINLLIGLGAKIDLEDKIEGSKSIGQSPLHLAVTLNHINCVEHLIANKADLNVKDVLRSRPVLHIAASSEYLQCLKSLILAGADINQTNILTGCTVFHEAVLNNKPKIINFLLQLANENSYFYDLEIKDKYLPKIKHYGQTALHMAAFHGKIECVELLLAAGASTAAKDGYEKKPVLHLPVFHGYYDCVIALIKAGADVNMPEELTGRVALHKAVIKDNVKSIEMLVTLANANTEIKDINGETPLSLAVTLNHKNSFEQLIKLGANIQEISLNENNSIYWYGCAANQECAWAQFKLGKIYEKGINVDKNEQIAIQWFQKSAENGYQKSKNTLIKLGISCDISNEQDKPTISHNDKKSIPEINPEGKLEISLGINDMNELKLERRLNSGGFGTVYIGRWSGRKVAIKELFLKNLLDATKEEFKREAAIMMRLHSPFVVTLYGITLQFPYYMVMELMKGGSLYFYLNSGNKLEWKQRLRIAAETAQGLAFLHQRNIIHRDLKSMNILLDSKKKHIKLADFGLAKVKFESSSQENNYNAVGTLAWMAPELFCRGSKYTKASDVYSLGVVLWELASCQVPFADAPNSEMLSLWIKQGQRERIPDNTPDWYCHIIENCWKEIPEERPTAEAVANLLKFQLNAEKKKIIEVDSSLQETQKMMKAHKY